MAQIVEFLELTSLEDRAVFLKRTQIGAIVGTATGCTITLGGGMTFDVKETAEVVLGEALSYNPAPKDAPVL